MSDINVQTFSGKVNVANNLKVGSSHFFVDTQNNNVGIGTNNPTHTLDVHGTANVGVLTATFLHGDGSNIQNIVSSQWQGTSGDPIYYSNSVGIATTTAPTRTLEVGSNLYVEDTGSNVLVVDGNVAATSITIGDATIVASQGLDHVTNENNTTTQVVQFNNPTTGFVTASNAVIGGTLSLQNFALSQSYGLENVTGVNNTTGDTIVSSNATTGFQSTANVSVGRDALVTGNVTVGKDLTVSEEATFSSNVTIAEDLEVSGNVTNLDVLSNVNLLSVSNVVSIRRDSNVVTEFSRSKKLIKYPRVALTSAASTTSGYQGYKVTSSFSHSGYNDWEAFDNGGDTVGWHTADGALREYNNGGEGTYSGTLQTRLASNTELGEWLQIELPEAIRLERYIIIPQGTLGAAGAGNCPSSAVVYGSNDGTTWKEVHRYTDQIVDSGGCRRYTFQTNSTETYNRFAIVVTKRGTSGGSGYGVSIQEWDLFGTPEYDPDAHGVDVKVTSYPNIPNTDWLEVYYDAKDLTGVPSTVLDMSGNSRNGTLNGGVSVSDGAFVFDGSGDYISTTLNGLTGGNLRYAVSMWIKMDRFGASNGTNVGYIYALGNASAARQKTMVYVRQYNTGEDPKYQLVFAGYTYDYAINKNDWDLNRWYHVVTMHEGGTVNFSGANAIVYVDGVRVDCLLNNVSSGGDAGNTLSIANNPTLTIGGNGSVESYSGSIANFRLFNRVLASDEVYQLYAYQKEYFGYGDLSMTFKAGRLGIGTSEPRAMLDVRGNIHAIGSVNPVIGMWKQTIDSTTVTTTIVANIGSCMSTKTPDGYGTATGFSGSAGIFIAPYDGIYQFQAFLVGQSGSSNCLLVFNANGPSVVNGTWGTKNVIAEYNELFDLRGDRTDEEEPFTFATLLNMSKGDYVDIQNHSTGYLGHGNVNCSAYLIHRFN